MTDFFSHFVGLKQLSQADCGVLKKFHLLVWEQASTLFEVLKIIEILSCNLFTSTYAKSKLAPPLTLEGGQVARHR